MEWTLQPRRDYWDPVKQLWDFQAAALTMLCLSAIIFGIQWPFIHTSLFG